MSLLSNSSFVRQCGVLTLQESWPDVKSLRDVEGISQLKKSDAH
jgi:hypothetical protein